MSLAQQDYRHGIRVASAIASCVAANTAVNLYNPAAQADGATSVIRKIMITNRTGGQVNVTIGTGAGPTAGIPVLTCIAGDNEWAEDVIPCAEFAAQITVASSAAGAAPADVQVQIEVENYHGSTAHN